jgi:hypothetical protein
MVKKAKALPVDVGRDEQSAYIRHSLIGPFNAQMGGGDQELFLSPDKLARAVNNELFAKILNVVLYVGEVIVHQGLEFTELFKGIEQAQNVNIFLGLQFHAREHMQACIGCRLDHSGNIVSSIVICDSNQVQTTVQNSLHDQGGNHFNTGAGRKHGVNMQLCLECVQLVTF